MGKELAVRDWDYSYSSGEIGVGNKDWNQTIVTRINELSKIIHLTDFEGGGDQIIISPSVLEIFKTLEYVRLDEGEYELSSRYKIIIEENAEPNTVLVVQSETGNFGKIKILNYG